MPKYSRLPSANVACDKLQNLSPALSKIHRSMSIYCVSNFV